MSDQWTGLPFETTARLLDAGGFDPNTVIVEGLTEDGYYTFVYDRNGNRAYDPVTLKSKREWRSWGREFGAKVLKAHQFDLDNGAERKIEENQK